METFISNPYTWKHCASLELLLHCIIPAEKLIVKNGSKNGSFDSQIFVPVCQTTD